MRTHEANSYDFHCGNDNRFVKVAINSDIFHTIRIQAEAARSVNFVGGTRKVEEILLYKCFKLTRIHWPKYTGHITRLRIYLAERMSRLDLSRLALQNLQELSILNCTELTDIIGLPASLKWLNVHGANIKTVDVSHCPALECFNIVTTSEKFSANLDGLPKLHAVSILTANDNIENIHEDFLKFQKPLLHPEPGPDDDETVIQLHGSPRERNHACMVKINLLSMPLEVINETFTKNYTKEILNQETHPKRPISSQIVFRDIPDEQLVRQDSSDNLRKLDYIFPLENTDIDIVEWLKNPKIILINEENKDLPRVKKILHLLNQTTNPKNKHIVYKNKPYPLKKNHIIQVDPFIKGDITHFLAQQAAPVIAAAPLTLSTPPTAAPLTLSTPPTAASSQTRPSDMARTTYPPQRGNVEGNDINKHYPSMPARADKSINVSPAKRKPIPDLLDHDQNDFSLEEESNPDWATLHSEKEDDEIAPYKRINSEANANTLTTDTTPFDKGSLESTPEKDDMLESKKAKSEASNKEHRTEENEGPELWARATQDEQPEKWARAAQDSDPVKSKTMGHEDLIDGAEAHNFQLENGPTPDNAELIEGNITPEPIKRSAKAITIHKTKAPELKKISITQTILPTYEKKQGVLNNITDEDPILMSKKTISFAASEGTTLTDDDLIKLLTAAKENFIQAHKINEASNLSIGMFGTGFKAGLHNMRLQFLDIVINTLKEGRKLPPEKTTSYLKDIMKDNDLKKALAPHKDTLIQHLTSTPYSPTHQK